MITVLWLVGSREYCWVTSEPFRLALTELEAWLAALAPANSFRWDKPLGPIKLYFAPTKGQKTTWAFHFLRCSRHLLTIQRCEQRIIIHNAALFRNLFSVLFIAWDPQFLTCHPSRSPSKQCIAYGGTSNSRSLSSSCSGTLDHLHPIRTFFVGVPFFTSVILLDKLFRSITKTWQQICQRRF